MVEGQFKLRLSDSNAQVDFWPFYWRLGPWDAPNYTMLFFHFIWNPPLHWQAVPCLKHCLAATRSGNPSLTLPSVCLFAFSIGPCILRAETTVSTSHCQPRRYCGNVCWVESCSLSLLLPVDVSSVLRARGRECGCLAWPRLLGWTAPGRILSLVLQVRLDYTGG